MNTSSPAGEINASKLFNRLRSLHKRFIRIQQHEVILWVDQLGYRIKMMTTIGLSIVLAKRILDVFSAITMIRTEAWVWIRVWPVMACKRVISCPLIRTPWFWCRG